MMIAAVTTTELDDVEKGEVIDDLKFVVLRKKALTTCNFADFSIPKTF